MRKRYPDTAITTVCIPWDEQWNFDRAVFGGMVEKLIEAGLPALYLFGTAGEGYAVDDEQFQEIAAAFWDETRGSGIRSMAVSYTHLAFLYLELFNSAYVYHIILFIDFP